MYKVAEISGAGLGMGGMEFSAFLAAEPAEEAVIYTDGVRQTMLGYALAAFAAKLMQVDGPVNVQERKAFYRMFAGESFEASRLKTFLVTAQKDAASHLQYARQLGMLLGDPAVQFDVLGRMARLALADAPLTPVEFDALCDMAQAFGLNVRDTAHLVDEIDGPVEGEPHELLGVERNAGTLEIQRAYRERMRWCHPDRWSHKERHRELYRLAHRKAVAVNAAYERMMRGRAN